MPTTTPQPASTMNHPTDTQTAAELAHDACTYAAHNQPAPLELMQAMRAQVERITEERDALRAALESVVKSLGNPPLMSRDAQDGFRYHTAEDEYRVELCRLILETKEVARAALATTNPAQ